MDPQSAERSDSSEFGKPPVSYVDDEARKRDGDLMVRVQSGDAAAFGEIFDRYQNIVYQIAFRHLRDPLLSEDLAQVVFLKVWKSPESFRGGLFFAWIARVTRNCAVDELRRRKGTAEMFEMTAVSASPYERVAAEMDVQQLYSALRRLSVDKRSLIELNFFSCLTHKEIAAHTALPLGTVKTRIRAGLHALQLSLRESSASPI